MKRSEKAAALTILGLLLLATVPAQQVKAQVSYSESLHVDIAGSSALWFLTFQGINSTSGLSSFESTPGLSWYNITLIDTASWIPAYQVFGPSGYNLIPVPFVPQQGAFLTVGSDSFANASAAASALDSYLLTAFVSYSNSTSASSDNFTFYSPLSFASVVSKTLLPMVPSGEGGFADVVNASSFDTTGSPLIGLSGVKTSSTFERSLTVGSISGGALNSKNQPALLGLFGSSPSYIQAANKSTSSAISVTVLDGLMAAASGDKATVVNDNSSFSSTYSLQLTPGEKVYSLNTTVVQAPGELLAYRTVYPGDLAHGDDLTVTDSITNLSPTYAITLNNFTDDWWTQAPYSSLFRLVVNASFPSSIGGNTSVPVTPVYVLEYVGNSTGQITIPASTISYSFNAGGEEFVGEATLNPVPLSLGVQDADVFSYVKAAPELVPNVGESVNLTVVAVNEGNLSASSVTVAGVHEPGIGPLGGSVTLNLTETAKNLIGLTQAQTYSVTYANPLDLSQTLNATTNSVRLYFVHSTLDVGFPTLSILSTITPSPTYTELALNFSVTNSGTNVLTSFEAQGVLPQGLACGTWNSSALTCSSGRYQLSYATLDQLENKSVVMTLNITGASNYVMAPAAFNASSGGLVLTGWSSPTALPTGLTATKSYAQSELFPGMTTDVNITINNAGPYEVYNATIGSTADSFDKITGSAGSATYASISPGEVKTIAYTVNTTSASGSSTSSIVTEDFYFGGTLFNLQTPGPAIEVYKTLNATVTTTPASPTEGQQFEVNVVITNPSGVNVTGISLVLPFQSGTKLSLPSSDAAASGTKLTVTGAVLGANSSLDASVEATSPSGTAIDFTSATLTFTYNGVKLNGGVTQEAITVGENVTVRYYIPIAIAILALLGTAFYVKRKVSPIGPASQR